MLGNMLGRCRAFLRLTFCRVRLQIQGRHLRFVSPNYAFLELFDHAAVAIDVGTGSDPDFSKYLIAHYGLECFAVDPTRKHSEALRKLEHELPGFHYLPYALGPQNGQAEFYESQINVSGSILSQHRNIVNDPVIHYNVPMVTLAELLRIVGRSNIAVMKIDVEGAEYPVLQCVEETTLRQIRQLLVEFHHDTVAEVSWQDTGKAIHQLESMGMKSIVYNGRDCLFYW